MPILQTWTIQSSNGIVLLEFGSFDVQSSPSCWGGDYVEISYGSFSQKYCNQNSDIPGPTPGPFTSFGSPITVKFITGSTGTRTGFLAAACCGVTVTNSIDTGKQILLTRKKAAYRPLFPRPCGQLVGLYPTCLLFI